MSTQDIVQKLWNLCNVLRDDGITYHQYVTELTYILFLKMLEETGEESKLQRDIEQAYKKRLQKYAANKNKSINELTEEEIEDCIETAKYIFSDVKIIKGHGRLIDAEEVKKRYPIMENDFGMVINEGLHKELDKIPTIIEADKE